MKRGGRQLRPRGPRPPLTAPAGLTAERFDLGGEAYLILEWLADRRRPDPSLGPAEREVLELLLAGLSNSDIAARRRRSARTVAHQVERIYRRLGVGSRLELFALLARAVGSAGRPPR